MKSLKNNPCLYIENNNKEIRLNDKDEYDNVEFSLKFDEFEEYGVIRVEMKNRNSFRYEPQKVYVKLGADTYMDTYPQWNTKFFPSMFRFEETHMYGYFMSPDGDVTGICSPDAAAGYSFDYNRFEGGDYGHRINDVNFYIICAPPLPKRMNKTVTGLEPGESRTVNIYLLPCLNENNVFYKINKLIDIPIIKSKKYTLSKGEKIEYDIISNKSCSVELIGPDGKAAENTDKVGAYTLTVKQNDGFISTAMYYLRNDYKWYLKKAAENMISKPQKATTHCESWYGFFSGYLAMKHYPDAERDKITNAMFDEIMPLMFDFNSARPKVIPNRVQNISSFISLLVDRYEAQGEDEYLRLASLYGDLLLEKQHEDGGYYRENTHYTCVIYPAKSLMELYHAELAHQDEYFKKQGEKHYESVKRAIDDLVNRLDNVETEGEMTFEDGMISCSALQIAYFALELPINEREKYIRAAEYMINKHRCLEQNNIADCRMNGASIRYWEAQYDINYKGNMLNSPHGWTAWTLYAKYYLFLLTGKAVYLREFENGLGACLQLMSADGDLRWSFICEPHIETDIFVPDTKNPIADAYKSVKLNNPGLNGKYQKAHISEQYLPMVSDWYRASEENPLVGGYSFCPLFLENETRIIDNQGGVCDNDVHEIFKCMEETVLGKAFIAEEDGELLCWGCSAEPLSDGIYITADEDVKIVYSGIKGKRIYFKDADAPKLVTVG